MKQRYRSSNRTCQNPSLVRRQCLRFALYLKENKAIGTVGIWRRLKEKTSNYTKDFYSYFYFYFFKRKKELGGEVGNRPDRVVGSHPNPVGDRPVLTHLLRQLFLYYKCLVGRLRIYIYIFIQTHIKNSLSFQQKSLANEG